MGYKKLFIWVEGNDDLRFFDKIIIPSLSKNFDLVKIIPYANLKKKKIDNYIKSIKSMKANYIYVVDINNSPCPTFKKREIQNKFRNIEGNRIIVVIKEIESWYLAGLCDKYSHKLINRSFNITDDIPKKQFDDLIPQKFYSRRTDFMLETLKFFSIETAKQKNKSFNYFMCKCSQIFF